MPGAQVRKYDLKCRGSSLYTAALLSPLHAPQRYVSIGRSIKKVQGQQCFRAWRHRATSMLLMELMSSFRQIWASGRSLPCTTMASALPTNCYISEIALHRALCTVCIPHHTVEKPCQIRLSGQELWLRLQTA